MLLSRAFIVPVISFSAAGHNFETLSFLISSFCSVSDASSVSAQELPFQLAYSRSAAPLSLWIDFLGICLVTVWYWYAIVYVLCIRHGRFGRIISAIHKFIVLKT